MSHESYKQFCPVAMAAEVVSTRWTVLLLRELIAGSTRFNDLRRGLPRMSPTLLSKRLRDLETIGVVRRISVEREPGVHEYHLTPAGRDLEPIVTAYGIWGQRWVESAPSLNNLDAGLLMWDMRRNLDLTPLPPRRSVIHFQYPELAASQRAWWLIADPEAPVDLCSIDPGFDVDLYVSSDLRTMTAIWMGLESVRSAVDRGRVLLTGDPVVARGMQSWLGLSPFAKEQKLAC